MPCFINLGQLQGRDSYRVRVQACNIGLKMRILSFDFLSKKQKIIFLECTPCISLTVILQVFTRILYLPQGGALRRLDLCGFYGNLGYCRKLGLRFSKKACLPS
jgi:hypothetical protein